MKVCFCIVLSFFLLLPFSVSAQPSPRRTSDAEIQKMLEIVKYQAHKSSSGLVLLVDITLQNIGDYNIKDIELTCDGYSKTGTKIDKNEGVIYELIPIGKTKSVKQQSIGLVNSSVQKTNCYLRGWSYEVVPMVWKKYPKNEAPKTTMQGCNGLVAPLNKGYPQKLDTMSTVKAAWCILENGEVTLQYQMVVDTTSISFTSNDVTKMSPTVISTWCNNPVQRITLNQIAIGYTYADQSGRHLGKVHFNSDNCTN